jgi:secondary thiamine-phosphate synthase enzyme
MNVYTEKLTFHMSRGNVLRDITRDIQECVDRSGITNGTITARAGDSICVVSTIEYESGCIKDLENCLSKFAPFKPQEYEHTKRWHDRNGHGHVRSAIMGASETFVVMNGAVSVGTWQQIVLCDYCPNEHPHLPVFVCVMGE